MTDLIGRLAAVTGPDRELDAAIADAVFGPVRAPYVRGKTEGYTASIDAALTLVPEGEFARVYCEGPQAIIVRRHLGNWQEVSRSPLCPTPALAICIAALRAKGDV